MSKSMFALVMEGIVDGRPHIEREITCYVKLRDLYDVTSIAKEQETHEQWRIMTSSKKGSIRIRLTDDVEYTLTTKEKTKIQFETIETEQKIEKQFFEVLKRAYAFDGYLKIRYNIPIEGSNRKWEVDVFKTYSGTPSLWIKLDYEFNNGESQMPEIPFDYEELIIPEIEEGRDEEVDRLWKEEWMKLDEIDA